MYSCLKILEQPQVFISAATVIVVVLLVWVQLSPRAKIEDVYKDVNLILGFVWTYLAILFALIAVGVFIYDKACPCAKGFLVLSFLMTVGNVGLSLGVTLRRFITGNPEPLSKGAIRCKQKLCWALGWILALAGLILISFSVVDIFYHPCFCIGKALLVAAAIYMGIKTVRAIKQQKRGRDY